MPDLMTQHREIERDHAIVVRKLWLLIAILLVIALAGWLGWQTAGSEQQKAQTNAKVAQQGVVTAEQLEILCRSRDPKAVALAKRYKLCEKAAAVQSLAPSINAQSVGPVPVQTLVVPGDRVTATSVVTAPAPPAATFTVPGPDVFVTRTQTVPGPVVTATTTEPGRTVTEQVTVPGPATTAVVTVPGPVITETVTIPGPEQTVTITVTAPAPDPSTSTATAPPSTATETVTEPPVTETATVTVPPGQGNGPARSR